MHTKYGSQRRRVQMCHTPLPQEYRDRKAMEGHPRVHRHSQNLPRIQGQSIAHVSELVRRTTNLYDAQLRHNQRARMHQNPIHERPWHILPLILPDHKLSYQQELPRQVGAVTPLPARPSPRTRTAPASTPAAHTAYVMNSLFTNSDSLGCF